MSEYRIHNDYRMEHCWFCDRRLDDYHSDLSFPLRKKDFLLTPEQYKKITITIPRCEFCLNAHYHLEKVYTLTGFSAIFFAIVVPLLGYFIFLKGSGLAVIWIVLIVVASGLMGMLIFGGVFSLVLRGYFRIGDCKDLEYAEEFPQVRRMKMDGWEKDPQL